MRGSKPHQGSGATAIRQQAKPGRCRTSYRLLPLRSDSVFSLIAGVAPALTFQNRSIQFSPAHEVREVRGEVPG